MAREISLDEVNIAAEAYEAWVAIADKLAVFLETAGADPSAIPDERIRLEDDGSLTVWVEIALPGGGELKPSFTIPPTHWSWRVNPN